MENMNSQEKTENKILFQKEQDVLPELHTDSKIAKNETLENDSLQMNSKMTYVPDHPVVGAVFCLLTTALMIWTVRYIIKLPVCGMCREKGANWLEEKLYELMHLFFDLSFGKELFAVLGVLLLIGISGFFAGLMDDALCLLPFGRVVRKRVNFDLPFIFRAVPAGILAVYFLILFTILFFFNEDFQYEIQSFSLIGTGYTAGMWFSQIFYALALIALVALIVEAFIRSGFFGLVLRVPLLILSNAALSILAALIAAFGIVACVLVAGIGLVVWVVAHFFRTRVIYY